MYTTTTDRRGKIILPFLVLVHILAHTLAEGAYLLLIKWRKRVGVEPTGDRKNLPPAGFEDREDHRTPCASVMSTAYGSMLAGVLIRA